MSGCINRKGLGSPWWTVGNWIKCIKTQKIAI